MRRRRPALALPLLAAAFTSLSASAVSAGAWPRGTGNTFLSLSFESEVTPSENDYASLFYERGLGPSLTFGVDAGHNPVYESSTAILFLRRSLDREGPGVLAVEVGAGWEQDGNGGQAILRPGASWGRGFDAGWAQGWIGVESTFALRADASTEAKLDSTLGLDLGERSRGIVQVYTSFPSSGDVSVGLAPSLVRELRPGLSLQVGAVYQPRDDRLSLKVSAWLEF